MKPTDLPPVQTRLAGVLCSPLTNAIASGSLCALWALFAYVHFIQFQKTAELSLLLLVVSETLTALMYTARRIPESVSIHPGDWLLAAAGTFLPLLLRPAETGLVPFAANLMVAGLAVQILGLLSLNRSFAIVPAKRIIRTKFMYQWVRHPIYAGYFIIFGCYLLTNSSLSNALIVSATMVLLAWRALREEAHLSMDSEYRAYMRRVRYRIIPGLF